MLKNYTSTVPASKSITYIEHRLVKHGARDIMKRYGAEGQLSEICFTIEQNKKRLPFMLPARVERVQKVLWDDVKRPKPETRKRVMEQAERTAWKLMADWVDIQLSLVELGQVEFMEVFLPYIYDAAKQQTFFESLKESGYKMLPETTVA